MIDMTLCDNVNCPKRMHCYRYLEGLRQKGAEGMQSYYMWENNKGECDIFIDIECGV